MELIVITGRKLKIMLTAADMKNYRLDSGNLDYDNTETRTALRSILDEVRQRTGFDAAAERVMIQVYPCRSGGCEMFVTKLTDRRGADGDSLTVLGIYAFREIDILLRLCRVLGGSGFDGTSSVYCSCEEKPAANKYYLILYGDARDKDKYSFATEYGKVCPSGVFVYYIKEHCRCICKNDAVEVLGGLYADRNNR